MKVKTRFAPSSTGCLHIGSIRTALYSWLFAKRHHGSFVLRIEDTDISRSNLVFIKNITKTLQWLGISWDEGPYLQSDRIKLYKEKINEMLDLGYAYRCYCSVERLKKIRLKQILKGEKPCYDRKCRDHKVLSKHVNHSYVVRFKNKISGEVTFNDCIRGKISFRNSELDDLVIQRANGMPTYNFCVVIDDIEMNISHVIRGEDHINNTPRQINIFKSLNSFIPYYAHVSMIVNNNKLNLSKRKNDLSILEYKNNGFLKEAILNYLIKLGWSYGDKEIFSILEMKKLFSLDRVSKSSSEFNLDKLLWFNHYYLNTLPVDDYLVYSFKKQLKNLHIHYNDSDNEKILKIINIFKSRCNTMKDIALSSIYLFQDINNEYEGLIKKYIFKKSSIIFNMIYNHLYFLENWTDKKIWMILKHVSDKFNVPLKNICVPLRIAITGLHASPSLNVIMSLLGKKKSLIRIKRILYYFK
ncbi:glutamate--tRNA ligase [Buchnera aphidicola]|uniref:glutamate--tRNA ligase n=1 Tax=Buchnera aphidicola TaxID=9 RepID=UPI0034645EDA